MRKKILPGIVITLMSFVLMFSVFALPASAATSIKNAAISISASTYTYTGKTIKPTVTVKIGKKKLTTKSYTVSYKDNKNVGKATITVKGKGSYTGTATKSFYIRPKAVSSLKATPYSTKIKLSWGKVTGARAYQVYQYKNSKWVKLDNTTKTSYTVTGLESATTFKFRVRAYAKTGSKYLYSPSYTSISATSTIGKPTTFKISNLKETSVTLSWNEVKKADEYRVTLTDEVTERTKTFTVKDTSISLENLYSYRDYTVRVRGYNKAKDILGNNSDYFAFKTAPGTVKNLSATAGRQNITVTWDKADNISTYQIYMCTYDGDTKSAYTKLSNVTGTSYTVNGLAPCTDYGFRVRAYMKTSNGYVYSAYTESAKVTASLGKVESFICTGTTNNSISLSWSSVPGAAGYKLFMDGKQLSLPTANTTKYTAEGLSADTAYNFYVIAHCANAGCDKCDENATLLTNVKTSDTRVTGVEFVTKPASIAPGKTGTVKAKVIPEYAENKNITYKSSNPAIATVNEKTGEITAIKTGSVIITATSEDGGKQASYTLTVKNVVSTGISVPTSMNLVVGEMAVINPVFTPEDTTNKAFTVTGADYSYSYTTGFWPLQSTKTETLKVSDYISIGANGVIRGLKATIEPQTNRAFAFTLTVRANDSGRTATVRVSVIKKMINVTYMGDDSPWYYGNSAKLTATVDSSISSKYPVTSLKWKSSDTSVATVSQDGTVTVKGKGSATITAYTSDNAYNGTFQIYCRSIVEIEKSYFEGCRPGSYYQIKASLKPGGDGESVRFASTDESVATVDSNGNVKMLKNGGVKIIVMTSFDTVNYKEVWLTTDTFTKPSGTKQQLFNLLKEKADSVKTSDNLPGFIRNDISHFTNFSLVNTGSYGDVIKEDDLYGMFSDLAAPKTFEQKAVASGSTAAWENYMLNVPVRGQYMTIVEGLEMSDIKSVVFLDKGSYTYDLKLILEEESFTYLPTSAISTRHGKVFDILTSAYLTSALNAINNSGDGMKITYDSFAQRYHDSSLTVSVNKVTGKVTDMKYDMNIDINIRNLKIAYSFVTYTANIGFTCNNAVSLDFYEYID